MQKRHMALLALTGLWLALVSVSGGLNVAVAQTTPAKATEKATLRLGHVLAPSHPYHLGSVRFAELVNKKAGGKIEIQVFHSSQIGSERDLVEGLQLGTVDLAIAPGTIALFLPKMGVFDLPFIFRDRPHAYKVLDGPIGQEVAAELPKKGLRLLAYWENGFRQITNSKRPILKASDLAGLKLRTPENKVQVAMFKEWGANVTSMSFGELFTALQQGTVDGQENPLAIIYTSKLSEVQKFLSLSGHMYMPAHLLISEKTRGRLSPEGLKALQEAAIEARDYERNLIAESDTKLVDELKKAGMRVNEVDKASFMPGAKKVWETFGPQFGPELVKAIQGS
jgi:TRAP-type transport system periplasmic protein